MSYDKDIVAQSWQVVVDHSELSLEGLLDTNKGMKLIFNRIDHSQIDYFKTI